jgi:hypothetical protein
MEQKNEGKERLLFHTAITQTISQVQFPIQWVLLALSSGLNWPERETDLSVSYNSKDLNASAPHTYIVRCLMKHKGNFILTSRKQLYFYIVLF